MVVLMSATWTDADVPDQSGRVALVTGSNTGLGYETAKVLAQRGADVVMAVRDTGKGDAAAATIRRAAPKANVAVHALDLGSLESVRTAAADLAAAYPRIDLLINNAGVMYPPKSTTTDGFELQFGTNHLGHFALTGLLLKNVLATPNSRIVVVASMAHDIQATIDFEDLQWERRKYSRVASYGQSKLANLMFAYALQRKLEGSADARSYGAGAEKTVALAAHPGISNTELMRHIPGGGSALFSKAAGLVTNSPFTGALATLRAATDPAAQGGQYYGPDGFRELKGHPVLVTSSRRSHDVSVQERLWTVSEQLTGVTIEI